MDADRIRGIEPATDMEDLCFFLREIAAQLAETNALLRSLIETNGKGEAKLRVRTLQY